MTLLAAFDPGKTTGWSTWHYDANSPLTVTAFGQISNGLEGFIQFMSGIHPEEVVAETFRLDGRTVKPDTTPLLIEGALSVLYPDWIGQPNSAKVHADDAMLKRAGLWLKGQPHATDSARHALALMKMRRHLPTIQKYWPQREGSE